MHLAAMWKSLRLVVAIAALGPGVAGAALITGSETVMGMRSTDQYTHDGETYGPYGWNFKYIRSFDGTQVKKHVEIDFVFDAMLGWSDAQKAAYKANIEAGIEGIWNNKYVVKDNTTGQSYKVVIDVTTTGPFDQTVTLHKGDGRADMLNWYETDTASINAHEFGHMLGLFDEYIGGAVNQYPNPLLSNDGLMGLGALNANPVMYARYYQQFLDYMNSLNPGENFSLVAVPEPASWLLACLAMGCVAARRRRTDAVSAPGTAA
jgi:hypothetical protein